MKKNHVGKKIKEIREDLEWPQVKIANALGLTYKAISAYEVGHSQTPLWILNKIAKMTDTPLSYFLEDIETPPSALKRIIKIEKDVEQIKKALIEINHK